MSDSNEEGKIALFGAETAEYQKFLADPSLQKVKAVRSSRKMIPARGSFTQT
tara:strand:- start:20 stop:175 length:156 start_codon:yes stop_codon:yes gene_type:complete